MQQTGMPLDARRPSQTRAYQLLLAIIGVATPIAGVLTWEYPIPYNPMAPRLVIGAVCLGLLAWTLSPGRAGHARVALAVGAYLNFAWFLYASSRNGFTNDDVTGLITCACVPPATVRRPWELALTVVFSIVGLALIGVRVEHPEFPIGMALLLFLALDLGLGGAMIARERAEDRLYEANQQLEERVAQRTREAIRASRAKSAFLANMSHELRTPLNAIIGYAELLEEECEDEGIALPTDDLGHIRSSAGHLLRLIDDVLDLSRIEADELELVMRPLEVGPVVASALVAARCVASEQRALTLDVPEGLQVVADEGRLRQVLVNLLSNADAYTPAGAITVRAYRRSGQVTVEVQDTGSGIAPDVLPHIFDRFAQGDGSATRTHGGMGLGLAVSRELVERMGGQLVARSEVGSGSTFAVHLSAP
ncbi:MAG: HAMP domain-containing sensor histidine kinase [Myxococcota bacterium]